MKWGFTISIFLALLAPAGAHAQESLHTERLDASFQDNGDWALTDAFVGITWHGHWINDRLMRVTGSDGSCFILTEHASDMAQLSCEDLTEVSILLTNQSKSF
ncbi:MAG: hypothetical protein WAW90_00890 [Minisyncoccia bacterium]